MNYQHTNIPFQVKTREWCQSRETVIIGPTPKKVSVHKNGLDIFWTEQHPEKPCTSSLRKL